MSEALREELKKRLETIQPLITHRDVLLEVPDPRDAQRDKLKQISKKKTTNDATL
jgi:hypothetical protein